MNREETNGQLLRFRRGALVVFEGLDQAGKTTQIGRLERASAADTVTFAHMPTGFTPATRATRAMLEDPATRPQSGLATQLFHLACHAESVDQIRGRLADGAVVLDRWWWSTVAYGWGGGSVPASGIDYGSWRDLIEAVWGGFSADIVLLFAAPWRDDSNNAPGVAEAYEELEANPGSGVYRVRAETEDAVAAAIRKELLDRGIVEWTTT